MTDEPILETKPTAPPPTAAELARARSRRNVAIGLALLAFVALVFVVTVLRIQANIASHAA